MRSSIFYVIILYLFYGSFINYSKWIDSGTYLDTPFAGINVESFSFGLSEGSPEIAPFDEWEKILIGKWKLRNTKQSSEYRYIFQGNITYNPDSTFVKKVSYSVLSDGDVFYRAGGTVRGTWGVDKENKWYERYDKCYIKPDGSISNDKNYDLCKESFTGTTFYGEIEDDIEDIRILQFNNSNIRILSKDLTDGLIDTYEFTKIK